MLFPGSPLVQLAKTSNHAPAFPDLVFPVSKNLWTHPLVEVSQYQSNYLSLSNTNLGEMELGQALDNSAEMGSIED